MEAVLERPRRRPKPVIDIVPAALGMDEAAKYLGRTRKQVYKDIAAGHLRTYMHGRCRMVLRSELDRHLRNLASGNYQ